MSKRALMIGLGEVLWDILPSGKVLGGAPSNFAYMTHLLGNEAIVASRVGNDQLGREACTLIQKLGLSTAYVQHDHQHETGTATVSIDAEGQPSFTIKESAAWDFLEWTAEWEELSSRADAVCFGSLAQRSSRSAETIETFLRNAQTRALMICDVNLRQSFYSKDGLSRSFQHAHLVKLNEQELVLVSSLLELGVGTQEKLARQLLNEFALRLVVVTRGSRGSLLVSESETVEHGGFQVKVVDAIGAGDAFTACLAHYYLGGYSLQDMGEFANRFASWVATQRGATPLISPAHLHDILNGITIR
jgi:fructokinase